MIITPMNIATVTGITTIIPIVTATIMDTITHHTRMQIIRLVRTR